MLVCNNCKNSNPENNRFCAYCGQDLMTSKQGNGAASYQPLGEKPPTTPLPQQYQPSPASRFYQSPETQVRSNTPTPTDYSQWANLPMPASAAPPSNNSRNNTPPLPPTPPSTSSQPPKRGLNFALIGLVAAIALVAIGILAVVLLNGNGGGTTQANRPTITANSPAPNITVVVVTVTVSPAPIATTAGAVTTNPAATSVPPGETTVAATTAPPPTTAAPLPPIARGALLITTMSNGKRGLVKIDLQNRTTEIIFNNDDSDNYQGYWVNGRDSFVYFSGKDSTIKLRDGNNTTNLVTGGNNPALSADGQLLTYISTSDPKDVFIRDVRQDASTTRNLTQGQGPNLGPVISPDGKQVAYSSKNSKGFWQLWVVNTDGSNKRQVTFNETDNARWPSWSPDGKQLAYNTSATCGEECSPLDIRIVNLDDVNAQPRTLVTGGQNGRPFWVEDYIFFNSNLDKPNSNGNGDIYYIKVDGTGRGRLTSTDASFDLYRAVWREK